MQTSETTSTVIYQKDEGPVAFRVEAESSKADIESLASTLLQVLQEPFDGRFECALLPCAYGRLAHISSNRKSVRTTWEV